MGKSLQADLSSKLDEFAARERSGQMHGLPHLLTSPSPSEPFIACTLLATTFMT